MWHNHWHHWVSQSLQSKQSSISIWLLEKRNKVFFCQADLLFPAPILSQSFDWLSGVSSLRFHKRPSSRRYRWWNAFYALPIDELDLLDEGIPFTVQSAHFVLLSSQMVFHKLTYNLITFSLDSGLHRLCLVGDAPCSSLFPNKERRKGASHQIKRIVQHVLELVLCQVILRVLVIWVKQGESALCLTRSTQVDQAGCKLENVNLRLGILHFINVRSGVSLRPVSGRPCETWFQYRFCWASCVRIG